MRIVMLAIGSRGNVQPFVAMGRGLAAAGHQVCIGASPGFERFVRGYDLDFHPVGENIESLMAERQVRTRMDQGGSPLRRLRGITRKTASRLAQMIADSEVACRDADLIVGSLIGSLAGLPIAQQHGIAYCSAFNYPVHRSATFPHSFSILPQRTIGFGPARTLYNSLSAELTNRLFWLLFSSTWQQAQRQALHAPPLRRFWSPLLLYAYSPNLLPRPAHWDDRLVVTGPWYLPAPQSWQPPDDLVAFLRAGPPPVYVGFGSISGRSAEQMTSTIIAALARAGQRGIIASGWGGLSAADLPATIFAVDAVPHDWLFPQVAAAVHHGGSGTTAAALRAGIPQIVVPFIADQFFWGHQVAAARLGPPPVYRRSLTPEGLAAAIQQALTDEQIRASAAHMGARVRAEDGVGCAVAAVEQYVSRGASAQPTPSIVATGS